MMNNAERIVVTGAEVLAFRLSPTAADGRGIEVDRYDWQKLDRFVFPVASSVDPQTIEYYDPSQVFVSKDGHIMLFSRVHRVLFQWDPRMQDYIGSISLVGQAEFVAYCEVQEALYVSIDQGMILRLDFTSPNTIEPFATVPYGFEGVDEIAYMQMVGEFLLVGTGYLGTATPHLRLYTYGRNGTRIDSSVLKMSFGGYSCCSDSILDTDLLHPAWSEKQQKLYTCSFWQELNEDGITYHDEVPGGIGNHGFLNLACRSEIRAYGALWTNKKGTILLSHLGHLYRTGSNLSEASLVLGVTPVYSAVFTSAEDIVLASEAEREGYVLVQRRLADNYTQISNEVELPGPPISSFSSISFADGDNELVVAVSRGPVFYVFDSAMNILPPSNRTLPAPSWNFRSSLGLNLNFSGTATLYFAGWLDIMGDTGYLVQRRHESDNQWATIGSTETSVTVFQDGNVSLGETYYYRVRAMNGDDMLSEPSDVLILKGNIPQQFCSVPESNEASDSSGSPSPTSISDYGEAPSDPPPTPGNGTTVFDSTTVTFSQRSAHMRNPVFLFLLAAAALLG
jgi:hypothetical protein